MRLSPRLLMFAGGVFVVGGLASHNATVPAQEPAKVTKSARGGLLTSTKKYKFETFFFTTGARVIPMNDQSVAIDVSRLGATATFYHPNSPKPWFVRELKPAASSPGQPPSSLELPIGLGNAPTTGVRVTFEVSGLPNPDESKATFSVPLEFTTTQPVTATVSEPLQPGASAVPRYFYGLGSAGYGYYEYTSPAQATTAPIYATPSHSTGDGSVGYGHRDWSSGRDSPLAKPWLRSID